MDYGSEEHEGMPDGVVAGAVVVCEEVCTSTVEYAFEHQ